MTTFLIGLNHKTAPLEIREQLAFSADGVATALLLFHKQFPNTECAILSTCNRVEVLVVCESDRPTAQDILGFLAQARDLPVPSFKPYLYQLTNEQAIRHLFRVASSLDSMVIGEYQIVNQLKQAYTQASEQGTTGRVLNRLFHHAFSVGKRIRTETEIGRHKVSIPSVALDVARQVFSDFSDKRTLVVGAGEMAQLVCQYLHKADVRQFTVTSRTLNNAKSLADAFQGQAVPMDQLDEQLATADIVVAATACPKPILTVECIRRAQARRQNRLLFLLDLAVPRNVESGVDSVPQVIVYDVDTLGRIVAENRKHRSDEISRCEAILDEELVAFQQWFSENKTRPLIAQMYSDAQILRNNELDRLFRSCPDLTNAQRAAVTELADRLTSKFMHPCVTTLRQHQHTGPLATLTELFHSVAQGWTRK